MTGPVRGYGGIVGAPTRVSILAVADVGASWKADAACRDAHEPELWFPGRGESLLEAKRICRSCPVRVECLDYAMRSNERFGIWGGKTERERRRIRREQSGGKRRPAAPMFTPVQRQRMVWLDAQGWTDGEIGAEFGCARRTVQRILTLERMR